MKVPLRRLLPTLTVGLALLAGPLGIPSAHAAGSTTVVINEIYARGGSATQPYNTKFVELFNATTSPVALSGYGLSYSSAANAALGQTCQLAGVIPARGYFLIAVGSNGSVGAAISADQTCTNVSPSGTAGSFTLLNGTATVDLVGWRNLDSVSVARSETAPASYPGTNSVAGSITRAAGKDTDNNAADFTFQSLPTPQNSGTTPVPMPPKAVTIAEIQGTGAATPLAGQLVETTGVVTAVYATGGFNGFYLQTPGTGGVPKAEGTASDGVFAYGATDVAVGDCVQVTGTAKEFNGLTEIDRVTVVRVDGCAAVVATELASLPPTDAAKEPYEGMLVKPLGTYTITNNYQLNQYGQLGLAVGDAPLYQATDVVAPGAAADAYEAANVRKYITLDDGSSWDYLRNKTAMNSALPYLSASEPMRTGSHVTFVKPVILDYRFQWNFQPVGQIVGSTDADDPVATTNDRPVNAPYVGGGAQLASFNVLNYFSDLGEQEDVYQDCPYYADKDGNPVATNGCEVRGAWTASAFEDQKAKIVAAINGTGAEAVALMEVENSAGITWIGHHRDWSLANLVDALNADAGRTRWAYAESPVVTPGTEDVIRVAFIYDPNVISALGPSVIDLDPAFANARYPLAQKFKIKNTGKPFVMVANHFKSKGSGEDDGTGQGLSNPSREAQARQLTQWVTLMFDDQAAFLLGDFNAYSRETPVQLIESAGYTEVVKKFQPTSATYQFSGRLGSLDHIFVNAKGMKLVTGAATWDINGDESIAFQYSRRNYNLVDFFAADPFASSDHDPDLVGIDTGKKP